MLIPLDDEKGTESSPWVNDALIVLNVAVFVFGYIYGPDRLILDYGHRASDSGLLTHFTSMFIHAGLLHLIGNLWFLWITGDNVEDALGHWGYLVFYFGAGVASGFVQDRFLQGALSHIPCVGASGAIAATMGAYICLYPFSRIKIGCFVWLLPPIMLFSFKLPALVAIGAWFLEQSQSHLFQVHQGVTGMVAYAAHLGGFLYGAVLILILNLSGLVRSDWGRVARSPLPGSPKAAPNGVVLDSCPACRLAMKPFRVFELDIRECRDCGGLWLRKGQTQAILKMPQVPYAVLHSPAEHPDQPRLQEGKRLCPDCHSGLEMATVAGVSLDGCPKCFGVFVERGELQALLIKSGSASATVPHPNRPEDDR